MITRPEEDFFRVKAATGGGVSSSSSSSSGFELVALGLEGRMCVDRVRRRGCGDWVDGPASAFC